MLKQLLSYSRQMLVLCLQGLVIIYRAFKLLPCVSQYQGKKERYNDQQYCLKWWIRLHVNVLGQKGQKNFKQWKIRILHLWVPGTLLFAKMNQCKSTGNLWLSNKCMSPQIFLLRIFFVCYALKVSLWSIIIIPGMYY